jgi:predicted protein tyrosine phosphatase
MKTKKQIPRIMVSTRWEAADWCYDYDSVLTVFSPASYCDWGHKDHKVVEFADRYHYEDGAPTIDQIQDILDWGNSHRNVESMLVHCKAGQSRSTAVAISLYTLWGMTEEEAIDHVYYNCRPKDKIGERPFIPNVRILEHTDEILGTQLLSFPTMRDAKWLPEWEMPVGTEYSREPVQS